MGLQASPQGMPEQLPAHEGPGYTVDQAVAVPVRMDRGQDLLVTVYSVDTLQGLLEVLDAPRHVPAVPHDLDMLGLNQESSGAEYCTVENVAFVQASERMERQKLFQVRDIPATEHKPRETS